uniref:Long-chain-fatty-acid--CoA ligase n=1 Tax=Panagrolaimus sp. PS1159 TaxID=55785 RepID=A0AC35GIV9_9BILA
MVVQWMDTLWEQTAWPVTVLFTLFTSVFISFRIWKGRNRILPPNGISVDQQSIELKNEKGVYKSALLKYTKHDTLTSYYSGVETLFDAFLHGMEKSKNGKCLGYRPTPGAPYKFLCFADVFKRSREIGSALIKHCNIKPGNDTKIGIYAKNSTEWFITCLGAVRYSMVTVPLYDTLGADAASYIVQQTKIKVIIVDSVDKIKKLLDSADHMPSLSHIILVGKDRQAFESLESTAKSHNIEIHLFEDLRKLGETCLVDDVLPKPEDLFVICYTSGTTGTPKGVLINHRNIVANISAFVKCMDAFDPEICTTQNVIISYLPLSHMLEQVCHWTVLMFGGAIGYYSGDIAKLTDDLKALQPTIFPAVPRLLNRFNDLIQSKVSAAGFISKLIFKFAVYQKRNLLKERIVTNNSIWDKLVFNKIQAEMGGKVRLMITGSAPISAEVLEICKIALGAIICEGYGQTEATAMATLTWPGDPNGGHCGAPAVCATIRLGDVPELEYYASQGKGEVLIKGPSITSGYFNDPEKTAELFDENGYLKTGDIGQLLPNGTIKIIDRRKHIFKLSQGEYVAPEKIENVYVRSQYVQQVFVDGDSLERNLVAIVVPEINPVKKWYKQEIGKDIDFEEIIKDPATNKFILADLQRMGKENKLNSIEQVKSIHLESQPFTVENGLLTPTLKSKRPQLRLKYKETIKDLYKV